MDGDGLGYPSTLFFAGFGIFGGRLYKENKSSRRIKGVLSYSSCMLYAATVGQDWLILLSERVRLYGVGIRVKYTRKKAVARLCPHVFLLLFDFGRCGLLFTAWLTCRRQACSIPCDKKIV